MFKKLSLLLGLVAALPASAFAWVGGPFDGGDYSQLLDDRGIYQTAFRFKNGSGYSQFGVNVDLAPQTSGSGTGTTGGSALGSNLNRTVLYLRGVTYFGMATGIVDHDGRKIMGMGNCSSFYAIESSSTGGGGGSSSVTDTIVSNSGLVSTANVSWEGKITGSYPELRYAGKGEITVLTYNREAPLADGQTPRPEDYDRQKTKMTIFGARKFFLSQR